MDTQNDGTHVPLTVNFFMFTQGFLLPYRSCYKHGAVRQVNWTAKTTFSIDSRSHGMSFEMSQLGIEMLSAVQQTDPEEIEGLVFQISRMYVTASRSNVSILSLSVIRFLAVFLFVVGKFPESIHGPLSRLYYAPFLVTIHHWPVFQLCSDRPHYDSCRWRM